MATKKRRRRRRRSRINPVALGILLILLVLITAAAVFVFKRYSPSKERMDLDVYFKSFGLEIVEVKHCDYTKVLRIKKEKKDER